MPETREYRTTSQAREDAYVNIYDKRQRKWVELSPITTIGPLQEIYKVPRDGVDTRNPYSVYVKDRDNIFMLVDDDHNLNTWTIKSYKIDGIVLKENKAMNFTDVVGAVTAGLHYDAKNDRLIIMDQSGNLYYHSITDLARTGTDTLSGKTPTGFTLTDKYIIIVETDTTNLVEELTLIDRNSLFSSIRSNILLPDVAKWNGSTIKWFDDFLLYSPGQTHRLYALGLMGNPLWVEPVSHYELTGFDIYSGKFYAVDFQKTYLHVHDIQYVLPPLPRGRHFKLRLSSTTAQTWTTVGGRGMIEILAVYLSNITSGEYIQIRDGEDDNIYKFTPDGSAAIVDLLESPLPCSLPLDYWDNDAGGANQISIFGRYI